MIKYEGDISYTEDLRGNFSARILFGALKFRISYNEVLDGGLYLFGHRIRSIEQIVEVQSSIDSQENAMEPTSPDISEEHGSNVGNAPEHHHLDDVEILKKLGKAGYKYLISVKDTLIQMIKLSDNALKSTIVDVVKKILKQFLPRRITGDFKYGLDDPYYTAKILEIFALFYAKVGDDLRVEPVWQGYCFLGSVEYDGKIHLTVILWNIIRLLANNQFRTIWREYNGK